jgi:hypothetical protein
MKQDKRTKQALKDAHDRGYSDIEAATPLMILDVTFLDRAAVFGLYYTALAYARSHGISLSQAVQVWLRLYQKVGAGWLDRHHDAEDAA